MEEKKLKLRMYFFTIYQLTGIQTGIQAGHAALEYAKNFSQTEEYIDFIENHKTWIILNGGTTNDEYDFDGIAIGTINHIGDKLCENDIKFAYFREPDLNNSLTAICFIADERVFNKKDYPDFNDYFSSKNSLENSNNSSIEVDSMYKEWLRLIGGKKNEFLRDLIRDKKLA